jgi:peptidoglycan/LPS O-acetylase OafA/YrhL
VSTRSADGRNFNLDVLRGVAILLVLLHHLGVPFFRTGGWIGVDLFFVLSGFLIAGLLFREWETSGRISVGRFYVRRGFKIYPGFYALLAVTLAINFGAPSLMRAQYPVTAHSTLAELFFVQNYFHGIWGQTWSLAVEEHFYLLLPLLLLWMQKDGDENPFRSLPRIFLFVAGVELFLRIATTWRVPTFQSPEHSLFSTHLRLDGLMFGVLLRYYYNFEPEKFRKCARDRAGLFIAALAVAMAFVLPWGGPVMRTAGYTLLFFGFGCLMCRVVDAKVRPELKVGLWPLAKLGYYSYSIYLWHEWARLVPRSIPGGWAIAFIAAIVPGIVMAHLIEIPVLALREKLFPAMKRTPGDKRLRSSADSGVPSLELGRRFIDDSR